jgi:hypothetical protein
MRLAILVPVKTRVRDNLFLNNEADGVDHTLLPSLLSSPDEDTEETVGDKLVDVVPLDEVVEARWLGILFNRDIDLQRLQLSELKNSFGKQSRVFQKVLRPVTRSPRFVEQCLLTAA